MSFLRHIKACNSAVDESFLPWLIGGEVYGWIRPVFAENLRPFPEVFDVGSDSVRTEFGADGDELTGRSRPTWVCVHLASI